ncbi:hypothetical protein ABPG72_002438 [Tetrahymena utriculariae]
MAHKKKGNKNQQFVSEGDRLKEQGNVQLQLENYPKAIEYYNQAIKIDDKNYAYFHNRSLAYYLLENFSQSLQDIQICKQLNKEYIQVYIREASAYHQLDQLDLALKSAQEGLQIDQSNEELLKLKELILQDIDQQNKENEFVDKEALKKQENLLTWIQANKGEFSSIKLKYLSAHNRSIVSKRVIQADETLISIPQEQVITLDVASSSEFCKILTQKNAKLIQQKHVYFALFLLQEQKKKNASHYKAYIDSLPSDLSSFPALFSDEELLYLEGTAALKLVQEQKEDIKTDYESISQLIPEFKSEFSLEQFRWAFLCSHSRVFGIQVKGIKTSVMVPLADMLNHKHSGQEDSEWVFDDATNCFTVKTLKKIQRNQQIHFSYGSKCNSKLFLNYGFVDVQDHTEAIKKIKEEERPGRQLIQNDYRGINYFNELPVVFCFDQAQDDPTLPIKAKLIGGNIPVCCLTRINEDFETQNSTGFLGYLRFICIRDPNQLGKLFDSHRKYIEQTNQPNLPFLPQKTPPLSVENEHKMWQRVQELLIPLLLKYKTTVVKDKELLESGSLSQNQRNCVLIRLGEKNILEYYIDMASKMMYLLENNDKKQILESAKSDPKYLPYFHYIIQVILARLLYQK